MSANGIAQLKTGAASSNQIFLQKCRGVEYVVRFANRKVVQVIGIYSVSARSNEEPLPGYSSVWSSTSKTSKLVYAPLGHKKAEEIKTEINDNLAKSVFMGLKAE